ncbi:MAG TPA: hypothetical protein VE422_27020 [Terriglobia bacterium]|nr:hypothetical protein [Terriglobia bacterium]
MSLAIEVSDVVGVLLKDGWHKVSEQSFELDKFEFVRLSDVRMASGSVEGISAVGARWKEPDGLWMACQLPNVIAVRME